MHEDIIRDIRTKCRLTMNGVASTSMRQKGLAYKVNFGLLIPQIKEMAKHYQPDAILAQKLWKEDTRELKILGTLLFPVDDFAEEDAQTWVQEINNQEVREQVCFNLFQNLAYADSLAPKWMQSDNEKVRTTGYWLLVRLLMLKKIEVAEIVSLPLVLIDCISEDTFLRNAALLALKHIGRQGEDVAALILKKLSTFKTSNDSVKQETYASLAFEFDFFNSQ